MENDLISRHEAYMLIEHEAETHELPASKEAYERAARIVAQMCPVNITIMEQKTGWWAGTVCTACGESTSDYYNCNYCPRCGAKMEGEL